MAAGGGAPLPSLALSSGPAVSEAGGGGNYTSTGDFYYGRKKAWQEAIESAAPILVLGVLVWFVIYRK